MRIPAVTVVVMLTAVAAAACGPPIDDGDAGPGGTPTPVPTAAAGAPAGDAPPTSAGDAEPTVTPVGADVDPGAVRVQRAITAVVDVPGVAAGQGWLLTGPPGTAVTVETDVRPAPASLGVVRPVVVRYADDGTWDLLDAEHDDVAGTFTFTTDRLTTVVPWWLAPDAWIEDLVASVTDPASTTSEPGPCPSAPVDGAVLDGLATALVRTCWSADEDGRTVLVLQSLADRFLEVVPGAEVHRIHVDGFPLWVTRSLATVSAPTDPASVGLLPPGAILTVVFDPPAAGSSSTIPIRLVTSDATAVLSAIEPIAQRAARFPGGRLGGRLGTTMLTAVLAQRCLDEAVDASAGTAPTGAVAAACALRTAPDLVDGPLRTATTFTELIRSSFPQVATAVTEDRVASLGPAEPAAAAVLARRLAASVTSEALLAAGWPLAGPAEEPVDVTGTVILAG